MDHPPVSEMKQLLETTAVRAGGPARAAVVAGGRDTEYLRAGRGEAIVIVARDLDAPEVSRMMAALASTYLVFAAAPGLAAGDELDAWLSAFLEGLGIARAHLLALSTSPHE
jgi:hypothetical protein